MSISREEIVHNLEVMSLALEGQGFSADGDRLKPSDRMTDKAQEVIKNTFLQAGSLEPTDDRIWVEIKDGKHENKVYSVGHVFLANRAILPDELKDLELRDEEQILFTVCVEVAGASYKYQLTKKLLPEILKNIVEDLAEEVEVDPVLPIKFRDDISKELLDVAFEYMKTKGWPAHLSLAEHLALLRFSNNVEHPQLQQRVLKGLAAFPLEEKSVALLPHELVCLWMKKLPPGDVVEFAKQIDNQTAIWVGATWVGTTWVVSLLNDGYIQASQFANMTELKNCLPPTDLERLFVLDMSAWNELKILDFRILSLLFPNIRKIKLPAHIDDALLAGLSYFKNLENLDLNGCHQLTDAGIAHLSALVRLRYLSLRGCVNLTNEGLAYLAGLVNLEHLDFEKCAFVDDTSLKHLSALVRLKFLNLGNNPLITDAGIAHLSGLGNLEFLDLANASLTDTGIAHLSGFGKLKSLILSNCLHITSASLVHLSGLVRLKFLNLGDNPLITDAGIARLSALKKLKSLNLNHTAVSDVGIAHLSGLVNLVFLSLENCDQLTDGGLAHLSGFVNLTLLYLSNCSHFTDSGLECLWSLVNLEIVFLENCNQLTDRCLKVLSAIASLRYVLLRGCESLTEKGKQELQVALPNLLMG